MISDDKYWGMELGDLLIITDGKENEVVEFVEHLYDGGFFYRSLDDKMWKTAHRDEIYCLIVKGKY